MKKKFLRLVICLLLLYPSPFMAYSDYIIPGGESIGIAIKSKGVMIIGFYDIDGISNRGTPSLEVGDIIYQVNDDEIQDVDDVIKAVEKNAINKKIDIYFTRNENKMSTSLDLINSDGGYKTGLYIKDSLTGIGTLTYIDPESKVYGALGHEIAESNTNKTVKLDSGKIFKSFVMSIERSKVGFPGGKRAQFYNDFIYGSVKKNTTHGIYGLFTFELPNKKLMEVGQIEEIKLGPAKIYTVLDGDTLAEYNINIKKIYYDNDTKNIGFDIIDDELLAKTGGVVQGMSGSPIIQDDKIIGAVTHVVIENPLKGYGIFITTMLEEGDK